MSLLVLIATMLIALVLSDFLDLFPGVLWNFFHWPKWLALPVVLLLLAWCTDPKEG